MTYQRKKRLTTTQYVDGLLKGDKVILSRAITLAESKLDEDNQLAEEILENIMPHTGKSVRIGITGVPGVGKSTFIEVLGKHITESGFKLAVLAIDPSSQLSKGSIMGDKTRMEELSRDPRAYIRPSPTGDSIGGVSTKTRESMLLCEATGYDVIFIETVGVGQSETAVKEMVDFFLLLLLAGAGDELQGIKKGIMELADALIITKADGNNKKEALLAQAIFQNTLHYFPPNPNGWQPKVITCSALNHDGIEEIWQMIMAFQSAMQKTGYLKENRSNQDIDWMWSTLRELLQKDFNQNLGCLIFIVGAVLAPFTYYLSLLVGLALDLLLYLVLPYAALCYTCRSIYRGYPRNPEHTAYDPNTAWIHRPKDGPWARGGSSSVPPEAGEPQSPQT